MATVAIIHAAEDALPARALAEKLRQAKLTVVLEKQLGDELRSAVKDSKVTLALWSPRSIGQQPLVDDAVFARGKSKLVHVVMQNASAPSQFSNDSIVNLTGWRGEDDFAAWRDLAKLVTDKAGVAPLPPPAPRSPSPFFTPGAVNPQAEAAAAARHTGRVPGGSTNALPGANTRQLQPRQTAPRPQQSQQRAPQSPPPRPAAAQSSEPKKGGGAGLMIGIAAVVVLGLAGGGYYFYNQSQTASSTSAAWESVAQNDADALRAFISGDPGDFRDEAESALAALEDRSFEAASDSDTIEALENFLNDFPDSQHAITARGRIAELQTLEPAGETPLEAVLPPEASSPDPDLVPPNATGSEAGPSSLTPPPEPTITEEPEALPTN